MASEDEFLSDEEFARRLQDQFNNEAKALDDAEEENRKFAQTVAAGVHEISDSGSDAGIIVVKETTPKKKPEVKTSKIPAMKKQSSSIHTISDSDDETQVVASPCKQQQKQQKPFKFSFMKHDSDADSDGTLELSSDDSFEKPATNTCQPNKKSKPTPGLIKRASSSLHEMSDSGEESDSIISPSPKKSTQPSPKKSTPPSSQKSTQSSSQKSTPPGLKKSISSSLKKSTPRKATPRTEEAGADQAGTSGMKRKHSDDDDDEVWGSQETVKNTGPDGKPRCKFGKNCYRRNPSHTKQFWHPEISEEEKASRSASKKPRMDDKDAKELFDQAQPLSFLMTKVSGIESHYNNNLAIHIDDILHPRLGKLVKSAQFNYKIDIPWLVERYPPEFRDKPLLVVHGATREEKLALQMEANNFEHIRLCQAKLEIAFGTHHTKLMLLKYEEGMRIVIHTSNLIHHDWHQKSQGVWMSPLFPKLDGESATEGESITFFKRDMLQYLAAYKTRPLEDWQKEIKCHDLSSAKVHIISSVPGRFVGDAKHSFGHLKLRKVLNKFGPEKKSVRDWSVIGQFSSVGSMGKDAATWLTGEWLQSLSATRAYMGELSSIHRAKLSLIYPCKENVRLSLEGYPAGGSLPYSITVAKKQPFLHEYFHQWKSDLRGRSRASPHIKTYTRVSPDNEKMAWFCVTSANLSKAAWGMSEKGGNQVMIRSYEMGVLFLPQHFGSGDSFNVMTSLEKYNSSAEESLTFPVPFDLPLTNYQKGDRPWVWDIPYVDKPDCNGMKWCPK